MADTIKPKRATQKFSCGGDFENLTVVNFLGPGGSKLCAYSCNMNLDLDGEPQAYAPFSKPQLRPKDNLGNACWKSATDNTKIQVQYEAGKKALAELEQKKADLIAEAKLPPDPAKPASASAKAATDKAIKDLDDQIAKQKKHLRAISFEHTDANGNYSDKNPKNFEKIFWKWCGVVALTPAQAKNEPKYLEMMAPTVTLRKPELDTTSYYEDVFGRFPVVQSVFEPGTDYFVSPVSSAGNTRYRSWDQRYYLPNDAYDQRPFGALSGGLIAETGLKLNDTVFAIRFDTGDTL